MRTRFAAAALALVLASCAGSEARPAPDPGGQAGSEVTDTSDPIVSPGAAACSADADCVATPWHDCCASSGGVCSCEIHAASRDGLEREMDACAEIECADGACPTCPDVEPTVVALCRAGACVLDHAIRAPRERR